MSRKEKRRKKYNILRAAGFTPEECTKLKDLSLDKVHRLAERKEILRDEEEALKNEYNKRLNDIDSKIFKGIH